MLTAAQREKCREIAATLDAGDQRLWLKAEPSLTPEMRGEVWDQRAHVKAQAERSGNPPLAAIAATGRTIDLDYWADDEPVEPDDDDDGQQPCPACNGRGKDAAGNPCQTCHGSGKVPDGDDDEDETDEEEQPE